MNDSNSVPSDPILPGIKSPADLKALSADQLPALAQEIREEIIADNHNVLMNRGYHEFYCKIYHKVSM